MKNYLVYFLLPVELVLNWILPLSPNLKKEAAQGTIQYLWKTNVMSYILLICYELIDWKMRNQYVCSPQHDYLANILL